jgi:hypothetical protein
MMNVNGVITYKCGYWLFGEGPETSAGDKPNRDTNIILIFLLTWTELSCGKNMAEALNFIHVLQELKGSQF